MSSTERTSQYSVQSWKPFARPWFRFAALSLYYLAILVALFVLYGKGNFSTPEFIYQNF